MATKKQAKSRGGARPGAGRKRRGLEPFSAVGPPPIGDPLAIAAWAQRIAAITLHQVVLGKLSARQAQEIRASVRVAIFALPAERAWQVERLAKGEQEKTRGNIGPETQHVASGESETLRGAAPRGGGRR